VIGELCSLAVAGLGRVAGNCIETGGILMGRAAGEELYIDASEEAPCEHRDGPAYKMNASDRIRLDEVLAARSRVEGFFRTFTSRDPLPEDADEQFVHRYFPRGDCVYLMIHARSALECVGTVCWFRDGRRLAVVEQGPFAMEPGRVPVLRIRPELPAPARARKEQREPESLPRRRWAPVLVCFLLSMTAGVGYGLWSVGRTPRAEAKSPVVATEAAVHITMPPFESADLQLDVHPSGKKLDIGWSRDAVRALHATDGKLTVTDGESQREFALGGSQMNAGKYRYTASHSDVTVRLIASAAGRTLASDSVKLTNIAAAADPAPAPNPETNPQALAGARAVVVPPAVLHEVQPAIPEGIRSRLTGSVVIPVDVQVSERGRVLSARASDQGTDGIRRYLAEQAQNAAREWQFAPARTLTGAAVAAHKTIEFVFIP
jgi:hypothetical protein